MSKFVAARVSAGNPLVRVYLEGTDGAAEPDLTSGSSGLKIEWQRELDATATAYSGSNIETISTIGTYAAPTSGKARFKEMSATTMQGWYEIHLPQAAVGTGDASRFLSGMVSGVTGLRDCPFEVELVPDAIPNDSTQLARVSDIGTAGAALTAVPWNAAWDAEVQSEATDALNAYDPPTAAELTSATSGLATAAAVALLQTYPKNVAVTKFAFPMYLTTGALAAGVSITGTISKDGGNYAALTDSVAQIQSSGTFEVDISQTEMNADEILLMFTGTGCVPLVIKLRTQA